MKIHFIGIGGIGVSALAQYYLSKGHEVSGSDLVSSEITDFLRKKGAKIFIGHNKISNLKTPQRKAFGFLRGRQNWPKEFRFQRNPAGQAKLQLKTKNHLLPDVVISSPAVKTDNLELKNFKKLGIKCLTYPQALGKLTKKYFTIAVSGTHGKSTSAAMVSLVLIKAGFDPTVIIGTKLKEFGDTNFRAGKSDYFVIEADEWQASFLNYWPKIIILTNIEKEHLDYYRDMEHILKTYRKYIVRLPEDGILVVNGDDENIKKLIFNFQFSIFNEFSIKEFSNKQKEAKILEKILQAPGRHNLYNALAALAAARVLGIPDKVSFKALSEYQGAWRRLEIIKRKINDKNITIVSDYGHHPTEIKATLEAIREKFPKNKIWCLYQPHQRQRTVYLFDDFVKVFSSVPIDNIIITDIYDVPGREKENISSKISSKKLVQAINKSKVLYLPDNDLKKYLKNNLKPRDVLVIMGAGDIYKLIDDFSTSWS